MKASVEWLKEYSKIDVDTVKLGDILTMAGQKVETIEQTGNDIKNVVVGKILQIEKHQDSESLSNNTSRCRNRKNTNSNRSTKCKSWRYSTSSKRWSRITRWQKNKNGRTKRSNFCWNDVLCR